MYFIRNARGEAKRLENGEKCIKCTVGYQAAGNQSSARSKEILKYLKQKSISVKPVSGI